MEYYYDTAVIGGGILGCFCARHLSRYKQKTVLLEAREDVCTGITRANSAIVYSGYDAMPDTLKARLTVAASLDFDHLCRELGVPFKRCGSILAAFGPYGERFVKKRYRQGLKNGVTGLKLLSGEEVRRLEPNLSPQITMGLYASATGTVNPWELGIAAYENARANGVEVRFRSAVTDISAEEKGYCITAGQDMFHVRGIMNCAGLFADRIREMVAEPKLRLFPSRGDYLVLDTAVGDFVSHVIMQESEEKGKGLNLIPTVDGNLLLGPSNMSCEDREDFSTSVEGLEFLYELSGEEFPSLDLKQTIRSFAALRPNPFYVEQDDIGDWKKIDRAVNGFSFLEEDDIPNFISLIGIKTPGLTCCNELGRYCAEKLMDSLGITDMNPDFSPVRKLMLRPGNLSLTERSRLAEEHPEYGEIVCRCMHISGGEIREAIARGATTVDGVKRRVGSGMGRCQGSFCTQKIVEILAEELGLLPEEIQKDGDGSCVICREGDSHV